MKMGFVRVVAILSICSWNPAQAAPSFADVLEAFELGGNFAKLEEVGVKPKLWKAGNHQIRKPRAGEWGQAVVLSKEMNLTIELKDDSVKFLKFGLTGDNLVVDVLPALRKKFKTLQKIGVEKSELGPQITYRSVDPPVEFLITKLDDESAKLIKARYLAEGSIGTAGFLDAIDKAEQAAVENGDEVSPLSIAKGIRLGQSLKELRALGLEARDWVTAGDPRPPKDGEHGISKEFGPHGASYEIQIKGPKLTYTELSFRGDGISAELVAFLRKTYGDLRVKKEEGIIGQDTTYSAKEASVVCQITKLDDEFAKKRRAKIWVRLKIGKDFRTNR